MSCANRCLRGPRFLASLLLSVSLTGCGGGVSIGIGFGDVFEDGWAPEVSLAVSPSTTTAGRPVRLAAAASDANGIEQVAFYRVENGGALLLFADGLAPYELDTATPTDGRVSVQYFARATDRTGLRSDSAIRTVMLTPP